MDFVQKIEIFWSKLDLEVKSDQLTKFANKPFNMGIMCKLCY